MKTDFTKYLKPILPMIGMLIAASSAEAEYPSGYYDSLDGKCGKELMTAVKNVVYNHTEITYGASGTWVAFKDTDVKHVGGVDYWWDMYSSNLVAVSSGHPGLNIEHSVANSWWGGTKNAAYKDLCHLNPSDQDANSRKSNYPLAELSEVTWDNGVTFVGRPKSGQGGGATYCFEPADEYKGDFARAFMYMFTIYNDISWKSTTDWMYNTSSDLMFQSWASELLLRWSTNDPVSQKERDRNDGIYKNQKNRNPFIDLPDLADHIWGSKKTEPYDLNGTGGGGTGGGDDQDSTTYRWLDEADSSMGDWTIEDVTLPEAGTYVWSWKSYNGMSYLNGSAYISGTPYESLSYAWSPTVSLKDASSAKFSFEHAAKFQTTLRDICKVVVKDVATGAVSEVAIPTWPGAGSWTFVDSGTIDLASFLGKEVNIGFKYASTTSGADTWEIKNAALVVEKATSGMERLNIEEEDDSFLVEVWGNNILAPQGAHIFDMNGREVSGENLSKGVYIVVKPSFEKSVKVMIGK